MSLKFVRNVPAAQLLADDKDLCYCEWEDCHDSNHPTAPLLVLRPTCIPGDHPEGHFHAACYDAYCDYKLDRSFR